jgi:hypothetical protein
MSKTGSEFITTSTDGRVMVIAIFSNIKELNKKSFIHNTYFILATMKLFELKFI